MTSLNDVKTSTFLLIWKALIKTFHMRYNTIWYCMVPLILKFDLGVSKFWPAARPMKVKADRPQKLISWVAAHMLLSHQVWNWSDKSYSKNKGFAADLLLPLYDLDLWPWPWNGAINEVPTIYWQLYKRCYIDVRHIERENAEQKWLHTKKKWTMSPRGLTVSCKSPPHIRARIDSSSPFGHALTHIPAFGHTWTQGVNRCVLLLKGNDFTSLRHQMTS
jgi:hypothetical protein